MKKKSASYEIALNTLIEGIPGWDRYYILQKEDSCTSKNFHNLRDVYESQCKIYQKSADDILLQLISTHGGKTLFETPIGPHFDFLGNLQHVLEGVAKLNAQGICHYDLHDGNILVDMRGTLRIIDFGNAFLGDQVNDSTIWRHIYTFSPEYAPQPPELSIQNGIHQNLSYSYALQQTIYQKKIFQTMENVLGISKGQLIRDVQTFWSEDSVWKGDGWVPFFRTYWRIWDSWAVGILFIKILQKMFLFPSFINGPWKKHRNTTRGVLIGLLQMDPRRRLTAEKALEILKEGVRGE